MLNELMNNGRRYADIDIKQLQNELAVVDAELVQYAEDVFVYALQLSCYSVVVNNEETEDCALDAAASLGMYAHTYETRHSRASRGTD